MSITMSTVMSTLTSVQAGSAQSVSDLPLRFVRLGLIALAGLTPLFIVPGLYEPVLIPQSLVLQIGALTLLGVGALSPSLCREARRNAIDLPLGLFLCWSALTLLWAHNRLVGGLLLGNWLAAALVYWMASRLFFDIVTTRRVLSAFFSAAGIMAALGILQFFFKITYVPQSFPPAGTLMNKNLAAEFVVIALPFGLVWFRAANRLAARLAVLGTAVVLLAYLYLAFSRAAWLALFTQAVLFALVTARSWRHRVLQPRVLMLAAAGATVLFILISQSRVVHPSLGVPAYRHLLAPFKAVMDVKSEKTGGSPDASALSVKTRLAVWRNTVEMVKDRPLLGVGIGNHPVYYPRYARASIQDPMFGESRQLDRVHNEPLQILAELGLPGLLLAAWLFVACWRFAALRTRGDDAHRFGTACALAVAGLTVTGAVGFPLRTPASLLVAAVVAAGLLAHRKVPEKALYGMSARQARVMRIMMGVVALLGLVIAVPRHAARLAADRHVLRAVTALNDNDFIQAENEAARALSLDPRRKEALFTAGTASLHLGRPLKARAMLERVVQEFPYDLTAIGNLAAAYAKSGDWNRAVTQYRRVVDLMPTDAAAHHNLAVALERVGQMQQALDEHRRAARFESRQATYRLRYAVAAMRLGQINEAIEILRDILDEQPDSAMAHKMLGVLLYEHLGRRAEGRDHLRRALDLDPAISDADKIRQLLYMKES